MGTNTGDLSQEISKQSVGGAAWFPLFVINVRREK
jgi:hypothetical protein